MTHRPLMAVIVLLPLGAWGQAKEKPKSSEPSGKIYYVSPEIGRRDMACDVPALVKAAREHLEIEDNESQTSGVIMWSGSSSNLITYDSCHVITGMFWQNGEEDPESKIRRLECELKDAKATLKYRREREEREAKKADALARLRSTLAACEVVK